MKAIRRYAPTKSEAIARKSEKVNQLRDEPVIMTRNIPSKVNMILVASCILFSCFPSYW